MTVRFAGFDIPLMDTLSDPFMFETGVLLAVVFTVSFKPVPGVRAGVVWIILGVVVAFAECFVVVVRQPVATINPTAIHRAKGTISFIGALLHDYVCF
jgi:hypothetical protein